MTTTTERRGVVSADTPQQTAALRQSATARKVRARFPVGARVTCGAGLGVVKRHVPQANAQGGYLVVDWDTGATGRHSAIALRVIPGTVEP